MEIDRVKVGERLRQFADEQKMEIKVLAEKLGMQSSSFQSSYLNGRSLPGAELLCKLEELDCDTYWLLTGKVKDKNLELLKVKKENSELKKRIEELELHISTTADNLAAQIKTKRKKV